jgi:hypothetical protein
VHIGPIAFQNGLVDLVAVEGGSASRSPG